jgi:hypothetical protein
MFRTVPLSIIRSYSLYTQRWYMSYNFVKQLSSRIRMEPAPSSVPSWSCSKAVYKTCMTYTMAECTVNNSWWWTEELSEICRVPFPKEISEIVQLVGFIIRIFEEVCLIGKDMCKIHLATVFPVVIRLISTRLTTDGVSIAATVFKRGPLYQPRLFLLYATFTHYPNHVLLPITVSFLTDTKMSIRHHCHNYSMTPIFIDMFSNCKIFHTNFWQNRNFMLHQIV